MTGAGGFLLIVAVVTGLQGWVGRSAARNIHDKPVKRTVAFRRAQASARFAPLYSKIALVCGLLGMLLLGAGLLFS